MNTQDDRKLILICGKQIYSYLINITIKVGEMLHYAE